MKRLLVLSAYYNPEKAASLYLFDNLCDDFAEEEFNVNLYTPLPTRGVDDIIRRIYRKKRKEIKKNGNLVVHRVLLMKEGDRTISRIIRYLTMNLIYIWKGLITKSDAIFVLSTPPTQGAVAVIIGKMKNVPVIYNLQDVFPDNLISSGVLKENSFLHRIGIAIERFTYKNCSKIIVISGDIENNLIKKGVLPEKLEIIRNWVDEKRVCPIEAKDNYLFDKYNLNRNYFYIVYAGNLGKAQDVETIIAAAGLLVGFEKIRFLIFGDGVQKYKIKKLIEKNELKNVLLFSLLPYSEVKYVYSLGAVSIVSCHAGMGGSSMPSKSWSIMATGTPLIACFDKGTELQRLIENEDIGLFCDAGNEFQLSKAILFFYENPEEIIRRGANGRRFVCRNLSRKISTRKYIEAIKSVC